LKISEQNKIITNLSISNKASSKKSTSDKRGTRKRLRNKAWPIILQLVSDFIAIALSFYIQSFVILQSGFFGKSIEIELNIYIFGLFAFYCYWMIFFYFAGLYKNWYERSPFAELFMLLKVTFLGTAVFYFLVLFSTNQPPRLAILIYYGLFNFLLIFFRFIIRRTQRYLRYKRIISMKTIIVGNSHKIYILNKSMRKALTWGLDCIGGILTFDDKSEESKKINILGKIDDINNILDKYQPEVLVLADNKLNNQKMFDIVNACYDRNIRIKIEPSLYNIFTGQTKAHNMYGIPFYEISPMLMKSWEESAKRIFDIVFSTIVIVIGLPFWILVALIIYFESPGGVFYNQPRVGKNGVVFKIFKFRSMKPPKEKDVQNWTKVGDLRITKFGRFIRKTHIDEIPQFVNVLIGEMSIVGPRPEQPKFVKQFSETFPYYNRRLRVRPGITGWWQVKYQAHELNNEEIENRLKDDFYYIENMSIQFDIEIVVRTVWCVLKGHGQA